MTRIPIRQTLLIIVILLFCSCQTKKHTAQYWYNKGVRKVDRKKYKKAIVFLNKAIEIDNLEPEAHNEKGVALDELNLFDDAIISYNIAISLKPDYADAYYNRGNAYFDSDKFLEAMYDYLKAIELNPDDNDYKAMLNQTKEMLDFK